MSGPYPCLPGSLSGGPRPAYDWAMRMRPGRLDGKVAIVTGCGGKPGWPGTGRATAILFAREGANVVLVDLDPAALADASAEIEKEGGQALAVEADLTRSADGRRAVESALARHGRLDVLVNNLGITPRRGEGSSAVDVDEESWDRILAVNLKSALLTSKHAVPAMIASGGGSIVNVSSVAAWIGGGHVAYSASKGGILSLTRDLAVMHGREGIRANCIVPGSLYTPMAMAPATNPKAHRRMRVETAPLGIEGSAWDVAYAALFLASDEARWISGAELPVDGGLRCTSAQTRLAPLAQWDPGAGSRA